MVVPVRYDVLDLRYNDGLPAVLRHVDGSGFAYYPSGRKAICISAHGADAKGKARRISAIVHDDCSRGAVLACFDEWGRGNADGQKNVGDAQAPKVLIADKELTVIDGSGRVTVVPRDTFRGTANGSEDGQRGSRADVALRLNACVALQHRQGRTIVEFQSMGVNHAFVLGELQGDEVAGMSLATSLPSLTRDFEEVTQKLDGVRQKVSTLRVDPSQKDTKPAMTINTSDLKDVLDNLDALQKTLAHPNLAPTNLDWGTELQLKKMLMSSHPMYADTCKNFGIMKFSGKCTEERLAKAKPTVATPKTVPPISQLRLPELITECASTGTLLVVVCLATFAQEQCAYAKLLAEKAHAELAKRFHEDESSGPSPVRLVTIELTELSGFTRHYGVREVPYCLMFRHGHCVHSKRLSGAKVSLRDTYLARPRVLLVEPNPAYQLKIERILRRNSYEADLAMDGPHALRLASRMQRYGIVLASSLLRIDLLRSIVSAVTRSEPKALTLAFNAGAPSDEDPETRTQFLNECSHVFPFLPGCTGLATVLARHDNVQPTYKHVGHSKEDFVEEILNVLDGGRTNTADNTHGGSQPVPVATTNGA